MRQDIDARQVSRPAFTLIELLVVLLLIAILVALGASAAFKIAGSQQTSTTRLLLNRLDSRLKQQYAYANDRFRTENLPSLNWSPGATVKGNTVPQAALASQLANGDAELARVIHFKFRYKQWFPTSFAEVFQPDLSSNTPALQTYKPIPAYTAWLQQFGITGVPSGLTRRQEMAACLYMIMQRGFETVGEGEKGIAGNTKLVNGVPILIDSWGNPLLFFRWPIGTPPPATPPPATTSALGTGISAIDSVGYQSAAFKDPLDPKGKLTALSWQNATNPQSMFPNQKLHDVFGSLLHPLPWSLPGTPPTPATPFSIDLTPVIVSTGPDGRAGVNLATMAVTNQARANDNIYSR
jgi:prepilin-type N-terminal cleavage/methylation domain-containing protein